MDNVGIKKILSETEGFFLMDNYESMSQLSNHPSTYFDLLRHRSVTIAQ
jgi:hypothetical protein